MIGKSALDKARADVDRARDDVVRWQAQQVAKAAELRDLEARVGDDVLAAGAGSEQVASRIASQVASLRAGLDVAGRTVEAAQRHLGQVELLALAAEADDLDAQALDLEQAADKRELRTTDLLRQLRDHEGADFAPAVLQSADGVVRQGMAPRTRTQMMRGQAAPLRQQARLLRQTSETGEVPVLVAGAPGQPPAQSASLLTDSLRAYRDQRPTVAV